MSAPLVALGIQNPKIDALGAFNEGQAVAAQMDMAKKRSAEAAMGMIGSIALGAMGGDVDGQVDPKLYEEGLGFLESQGVDVAGLRGKPEMARVAARGSLTALQQIQAAQSDRELDYSMQKFEADLERANRSYKLDERKTDLDERQVMVAEQKAAAGSGEYRVMTPDEVNAAGLPPGSYQIGPDNKISKVDGGGITINNRLPGELGARIGLGDAFIADLPNIRERIATGELDSIEARGKLAVGAGQPAALWRAIESGKESLVRNLTGAGMSMSEAENQASRYQISSTDSKETMLDKLDGLERDLKATREGAIAAVTGKMSASPPQEPPDEPQPGEVVQGFRFKGGDPGDEASWEPVQ